MSQLTLKINLNKYCKDAEAILVIDKMERGVPAKGGIRIMPYLKEEDICELAHEMTVKCSLAELPFGGGKGGIRLSDMSEIPMAMYGFGRELAKLDFVPYKWCAGPDINTDCKAVDAFVAGCSSVIGWRKARLCATGKSVGVPHEIGSTAYGLLLGMKKFIKEMDLDIDIKKSGFMVEGIGEVGGTSIKSLIDKGSRILGISDSSGAIYKNEGLSNYTLLKIIENKYTVAEMKDEFVDSTYYKDPQALLSKEADILILASPGKTINEENADNIKVKLIVEGSNVAYSNVKAAKIIFDKGIYSIPSVIINAGGVIASYEEWNLEMKNLMYLQLNEIWEMVKISIKTKIEKSIQELCTRIKAEPNKTSHDIVNEMFEKLSEEEDLHNKNLRIATKNINYVLEEKLKIYRENKNIKKYK